GVAPVVLAEEVLSLQEAAERVRAEESVLDYLVALVTATRQSPLLALGVSPRGSLALLRAARARALADGRDYLLPDDIKELAGPALGHRVIVKASIPGSAAGGMDGEAAINTGNNLLYLLVSALLALIVVSGILSEQAMRGLSLTGIAPEELYAGRPALLGATLANRKRWLTSYSVTLELLASEDRKS